MATVSGPPVSLANVRSVFGAPAGTPLHAFVRGGAYVPNIAANAGVPTAPPIILHQLAGAQTGIAVSMSKTDGVLLYHAPTDSYSTTTPATATATPAGGTGYSYAWSFTSNPYGCTLGNASSQTCNVSYTGNSDLVSATLQCVVTDAGGSTVTGSIGVSLS